LQFFVNIAIKSGDIRLNVSFDETTGGGSKNASTFEWIQVDQSWTNENTVDFTISDGKNKVFDN
jgi:hypothetical protein